MAEGWLVLGSEIKKNHAVLLEEANFNTQLQNNMCESKCVLLMISKVWQVMYAILNFSDFT